MITRHADVERVARDQAVFSSQTGPGRDGAGGTIIEDLPDGIGPGVMLNMCDPPVHTRIRGLVSRGFTPKGLRPLQPFLAERAAAIVDATLAAGGACDFLVDVAAELPLQTIAQIMGVPQADRHQLFAWTSTILDFRDRDLGEPSDDLAAAGIGMRVYGEELVAEKRARPDRRPAVDGGGGRALRRGARRVLQPAVHRRERDDAQLDRGRGPRLRRAAGGVGPPPGRPRAASRPRSRRSCGGRARRRTTAGPRPSTSSSAASRSGPARRPRTGTRPRTATSRCSPIPTASTSAATPNPHLAFGHGIHHCLGASLARLEIATMLEVLLDRCAGFELAGPVEWGRSNKHTSIRHLPFGSSPPDRCPRPSCATPRSGAACRTKSGRVGSAAWTCSPPRPRSA